MKQSLKGRRIAILAADGFEKVELTVPEKALRLAGAEIDVVSLRHGRIRGVNLHEPERRVLPAAKRASATRHQHHEVASETVDSHRDWPRRRGAGRRWRRAVAFSRLGEAACRSGEGLPRRVRHSSKSQRLKNSILSPPVAAQGNRRVSTFRR
jgi:hypothetical protein